ncbi:MAG: hypothetical protein K6E76_02980 [Patescibacteria group bacterium]|nr:hypothetical protein [Patescibacteria group bacterium]
MEKTEEKQKYMMVGIAVLIGLIIVSLCSNSRTYQEDGVWEIDDEVEQFFQDERKGIEANIREIEKEMLNLQKQMDNEKYRLLNLTNDFVKEHRPEKEQNNPFKQQQQSSFYKSLSIVNGMMKGTISSTDTDLLKSYKKKLKKYATIAEE